MWKKFKFVWEKRAIVSHEENSISYWEWKNILRIRCYYLMVNFHRINNVTKALVSYMIENRSNVETMDLYLKVYYTIHSYLASRCLSMEKRRVPCQCALDFIPVRYIYITLSAHCYIDRRTKWIPSHCRCFLSLHFIYTTAKYVHKTETQ